MDPVVSFAIPGLVGGFVIAIILFKCRRKTRTGTSADAFGGEPLSTDVINIARIRVAGIGGLGLVAMAVVVAVYIPRIGQSLLAGFVLGGLLAVILIVRKRRVGPMPSSGRRSGANTMLSIEAPGPTPSDDARGERNAERKDFAALPACPRS